MNSIESTFGIGKLIAKHLTGALDARGQKQLDAWLAEDENHHTIFNRIVAYESLAAALVEMEQINTELALANVKSKIAGQSSPKTVKLWPRIALAAAAVAAITLSVWFYQSSRTTGPGEASRDLLANDIAPGKNTATITMPDGKTITLSEAKTGVVINPSKLTYNDGSTVAALSASGAEKPEFITASTPRGGTYQITLPDKTKVWLNADSKISFPKQFIGNTRKILLLSGEAYFEVAAVYRSALPARGNSLSDRAGRGPERVPFIVENKGLQVEVLGTHFNLNTYGDAHSGLVTSLLEGSVRVVSENGSRVLKPGQRGVSTIKGIMLLTGNAADDVAWKQGQFNFHNEPLESIMKKVGRWYDVEVIYQDENLRKAIIWGKVSRFENISKVLSKLQLTGQARFKVAGRTVYVTN